MWWKKEEDEEEDEEENVQKQENQNTNSSQMKPIMQHGSSQKNQRQAKDVRLPLGIRPNPPATDTIELRASVPFVIHTTRGITHGNLHLVKRLCSWITV